ncbi:MAG: protein translocase subunit SecF [candidate division KSB1 bacterium]|nr:protein translocase subunit SecF [candidate division KSB1 bacterium]MDZ7366411.1 protein translocase subunit SecF [candidate division KSB1 bacterium]MDZ7404066.1 protein translocase subunit SecF [candidate division KSB1 bacterium]
MMQFFGETRIDFIRQRWKAIAVSAIIILAGLVSMIIKGGPKYGVDFLGGTVIQVHFPQAPNIGDVRQALADAGYGDIEIKTFGAANEILLRAEKQEEGTAISDAVMNALRQAFAHNPPEERLVESVGPKIGKELRTAAIWATLISLALILVYVSFRFEFIFAVGAVIALFHDVLITLSFFSLLDMEVNLTVVAAFLTIVGFSLNDTIVVMDRIRENRRIHRDATIEQLINLSVNQTLGRTIITSLTVFTVVLILLFFGGDVIYNFAFAMTVGVIAGVYSTVYIASPIVVEWHKKAEVQKIRRGVKVA